MLHKGSLRVVSIILVVCFGFIMLTGCGQTNTNTATDSSAAATTTAADATTATPAAEPVTLKYWTWTPNETVIKPVIDAFEKANPDIKIELTVMESTAYQQKLPVALSTGEDLDVVGVQPSAMVGQVKSYLSDLEPLMAKVAGADWTTKIAKADIDACKTLTGGTLSIFPLVRSGAMVGYYNAKMLKDLGVEVPKTIEDYKKLADAVKAKDKSILPASFDAKDGWVPDEMMLTVMGQTSDYYNQWRYKGASVDDPHFINALNDFKKFFDMGIFSSDLMDLDYGRAEEMFTSGKAATFFQGSWEAGNMLVEKIRQANKVNLEDVGVFALPTVQAGGKGSVRSFLDITTGVVKASKNQEAAAKWVAYLSFGDGVNIWGPNLIGTPGKVGYQMDESIFGTQTEKDGFKLLTNLIANGTADRNNVSGYSDIEGAAVQKVITGKAKAEDVVKDLQKEWASGKYGK